MTGIIALLLTLDVSAKLVRAQAVVDGSAKLGFTPDQMFVVGVIGAVCLVLYLIPRTAPIGALLWTGYFGGAIVTHLRVGDPATHPHPVSDLRVGADLGRPLPPRPAHPCRPRQALNVAPPTTHHS
jgi:hypothetical protein